MKRNRKKRARKKNSHTNNTLSNQPRKKNNGHKTDKKLNFRELHPHQICKYHFPYFKESCNKMDTCDKIHLNTNQYSNYCQFLITNKDIPKKQHEQIDNAIHLIRTCKNNNKMLKKAELMLLPLFSKNPLWLIVTYWLAVCKSNLSDFEHANYYFKRVICGNPENAGYHSTYATFLYKRKKDIKGARYHFKQAIKQSKPTPALYLNYGIFLLEEDNNYELAEKYIRNALQSGKLEGSCEIYYHLAIIYHYYKQNKIDNALNYYNKAYININNAGKNLQYKLNLDFAIALKEKGKNTDAKTHFLNCFNYPIDITSRFYYEYATFLGGSMGLYVEAIQYLEKAMEIENKTKYKDTYQEYKNILNGKGRSRKNEGENNNKEHKNILNGRSRSNKDENNNNKEDKNILNECSRKNEGEVRRSKEGENYNKELWLQKRKREFERFIDLHMALGRNRNRYMQHFEENDVKDMRCLLDFDREFLESIEMNSIHISMFLRKIEKLRYDNEKFQRWLKKIELFGEYYDKFELYGILSMSSFNYHCENIEDVLSIIGNNNKNDAVIIWNNLPRHVREHVRETAELKSA